MRLPSHPQSHLRCDCSDASTLLCRLAHHPASHTQSRASRAPLSRDISSARVPVREPRNRRHQNQTSEAELHLLDVPTIHTGRLFSRVAPSKQPLKREHRRRCAVSGRWEAEGEKRTVKGFSHVTRQTPFAFRLPIDPPLRLWERLLAATGRRGRADSRGARPRIERVGRPTRALSRRARRHAGRAHPGYRAVAASHPRRRPASRRPSAPCGHRQSYRDRRRGGSP